MASIALFAAGSAIGAASGGVGLVIGGSTVLSAATIGGMIGGAVGSYIDANYLFPPKSSNSIGPRVDDYKLQTSSEGAGINRCFGPENKATGTIIWMGQHTNNSSGLTYLEERTSTKKVGGKGGGGGGTQTTYSYYADFAIALAEGPVNAVRIIWADSKVIYTTGVEDDRYEAVYLHTGSESAVNDSSMVNNSSPNSHIESFEGAGNVPKYKNLSYMVVDSLDLSDFGGRIPTVNALIEKEESVSVRDTIADILDRAGLSGSQYDVSRVSECLFGYYVTGPIESTRVLEPILQAYDILVAEVDGVLHFFHRGDERVIVVDSEDLGGPDGPYPIEFSQIAELDRPSAVSVEYIDANTSYDRGQELIKLINPKTENQDNVQVPVVMTPKKAATVATRRLYRQQVESLAVALRLPPSYFHVTEGDILTVTSNGEDYSLLVLQKEQGANNSIELQCINTDPTANTLVATAGSQQNNLTFTPYTAPLMTTVAMDLPALIDSQALTPTVLVAASTPSSESYYRGSSDYEAGEDSSPLFEPNGPFPGLSVIGTCDNTLGGGVDPDLWDYSNTIEVTVLQGELESVTEQEVLRGQNHCLVEGEIVGFQTATLIGTNQYRLSNLLRGRRHTFDQIDSHGAGETFVFFSSSDLFESTYTPALAGATRYHRAVPNGGLVADQTSDSVVLNLSSVKPFSPHMFTGSRDGSNNLTMNWTRRTRSIWNVFSPIAAPLYEGQEKYEIDILDGSGGSVIRTIVVEDATTTTYSAAQQTADGLTLGNTVYFEAYMIDLSYGRGFSSGELSL